MNKVKVLLVTLLLCSGSLIFMGGACDSVKDAAGNVCGACGTVANGDATISGNASLDGIFKAVGTLKMSTGSIKGDFDANVKDLAAVFAIDTTGLATADIVAKIKAQFAAQITGNLEGGLKVDYQGPKCSADVNVSVSAQASCEAKAECEISAECKGGEVSVTCTGSCSGKCEGTCEIPTCEVAVTPGTLECKGECSGSCEVALAASAKCEGTCKGTCDATCSAYVKNTEGEMECSGSCSGNCSGSCEAKLEAGAKCTGKCNGSCKFAGPDATANCKGELKCEGKCEGKCSGGCDGTVEPPSCSAEGSCSASADCKAQANAQASASLKCTPPTLDLKYSFKAGVTADAQAKILGQLGEFKVKMVAILQGMAQLKGLVEGNASLGIEPPVVTIGAAIDAFVSEVGSGKFEIAAGLLPCVIPAFEESATVLGSIAGDMSVTLKAQADLAALIM